MESVVPPGRPRAGRDRIILFNVGRAEEVRTRVNSGLSQALTIRDGKVVPEAPDIANNQGVRLQATYVYADLAGSSKLVHTVHDHVAARIIRAYVNTASFILKSWGGEIRSFDGDRVMAIFIGENRNRMAAKAAMEVNWAVQEVIRPKIAETWNDTAGWNWTIDHGIGIDTGTALLIRTGVRGDNDIASVGNSPNVAAKLSELRGSASLFVTEAVYEDLNDNLWRGPRGEQMWSRMYGVQSIGGVNYVVYSSSWYWGP